MKKKINRENTIPIQSDNHTFELPHNSYLLSEPYSNTRMARYTSNENTACEWHHLLSDQRIVKIYLQQCEVWRSKCGIAGMGEKRMRCGYCRQSHSCTLLHTWSNHTNAFIPKNIVAETGNGNTQPGPPSWTERMSACGPDGSQPVTVCLGICPMLEIALLEFRIWWTCFLAYTRLRRTNRF